MSRMRCSRRTLLATGFSSVLAFSQLRQLSFAQGESQDSDILVLVFLRGGMDGLNLLGPLDDKDYVDARGAGVRVGTSKPNRGIVLPGSGKSTQFALHAKAAPLFELYKSGDLAFVHACGLTHETRSHFDAQSMIERGIAQDNSIKSGWLTRYLNQRQKPGKLPVVVAGSSTPESVLEYANVCCIDDVQDFSFQGHWKYGPQQQKLLLNLYSGQNDLSTAGRLTLDTLDYVGKRIKRDEEGTVQEYKAQYNARYPSDWYVDGLTQSLQVLARFIKMDAGLRVGLVDFDGWDTHKYQSDTFTNLVNGLSRALHAFYTDLRDYKKRVTVVVMSEFGRRLKQNESGGTDHGHGNVMIVLGGNVNGSRVFGNWPGLARENLDQHVDLKVTTDYRSVLQEVLHKRLKCPGANQVFPGFNGTELGIVRG